MAFPKPTLNCCTRWTGHEGLAWNVAFGHNLWYFPDIALEAAEKHFSGPEPWHCLCTCPKPNNSLWESLLHCCLSWLLSAILDFSQLDFFSALLGPCWTGHYWASMEVTFSHWVLFVELSRHCVPVKGSDETLSRAMAFPHCLLSEGSLC